MPKAVPGVGLRPVCTRSADSVGLKGFELPYDEYSIDGSGRRMTCVQMG